LESDVTEIKKIEAEYTKVFRAKQQLVEKKSENEMVLQEFNEEDYSDQLALAMDVLNINLGQRFLDSEDIGVTLCIVQQLISGMNPRMKQQLFIYNDYYTVSTICFYLPFLFVIIFIIKYTFLAVLTHYYRAAKEERETEAEIQFHISYVEFFKLTYEILIHKKKKSKVTFHISDEIIYDIRLTKVNCITIFIF
jgi:hypothetical protein